MADDNPLLKALPPAVDYLSYLTILEYNLTAKQLPILHDILQDTTLTSNIGWDLVHLLLPLLPESQACLQDVARLGNPREVVLKVTELLEALAATEEAEEQEEQEEEDEDQAENVGGSTEQTTGTKAGERSEETTTSSAPSNSGTVLGHDDQTESRQPPSRTSQFCALLDMLAILHPRIKTQHPSRFLSTSLQPVLSTYATLLKDDHAIEAVLGFIKTLAGSKRPQLPPRKSSTQVPIKSERTPLSAPDPEASDNPVAPEEHALQKKLLQSFLTFVAEGYVSSLPSDDLDSDEVVIAMSWSSRLQEQLHPKRIIPGRRLLCKAFEEDDTLHCRDSIMGQMLALTRDLGLTPSELVETLQDPPDPDDEDSDNLPSSALDVPLSRPGCLYLICATIASDVFFHAPSTISELSIFPIFSSITSNFLGEPSSGSIGTEAPSLVDSLLFLGLYIQDGTKSIGQLPQDDQLYTNTLQRLALLSANTPHTPLRYHAHLLASQLLHAHPNENVRLSYIKDTLQHCPYENLKASAVGWLKDEILASTHPPSTQSDSRPDSKPSIFATPACIETLAPHLFPTPSNLSYEAFVAHQPFFLAVLNFYYFLLASDALRETLGLAVIRESGEWLAEMEARVLDSEKNVEDGVVELQLLEQAVGMCRDKRVDVMGNR
ncbi:MAG: hypothetical protein Q9208_006685 [Pyrenodesmia sp. 3 TL-2023]